MQHALTVLLICSGPELLVLMHNSHIKTIVRLQGLRNDKILEHPPKPGSAWHLHVQHPCNSQAVKVINTSSCFAVGQPVNEWFALRLPGRHSSSQELESNPSAEVSSGSRFCL